MNHWLLKSEPDVFSFDHLKARPKKTEPWNGVRNYQVRNMMRDQMAVGDLGFFYHSSCAVPGTWPPCCSTRMRQVSIRCLALLRYRPMVLM